LYGAAPALRPGRLRAENSVAFDKLREIEIARLKAGEEVILDDITESDAGERTGRVLVDAIYARDDAILNRLQAQGIVAVWYEHGDRTEAIKQMMIIRAADLGFAADQLAFDEWYHDGNWCLAMRAL